MQKQNADKRTGDNRRANYAAFHRSGRSLTRTLSTLTACLMVLAIIGCFMMPDWRARVWPGTAVAGAAQQDLQGAAALEYLKEQGQYESLAQAMEAASYGVRAGERAETFAAANQAQGFHTTFTPDGVALAAPGGNDWRLALELRGVGYGERRQAVSPATIRTNGQRAELHRTLDQSAIVEWYENRPSGLEQGFTLNEAPGGRQGDERLTLALQLSAGWRAEVGAEGQSALLSQRDGAAQLHYDKLVVTDATGRRLAARMRTAGDELRLEVADEGARYPVTIDPTITQQAYLKASNTGANDQFGYAVAVAGDTAVVGAPFEASSTTGVNSTPDESASNAGAAYVFTRSAGVWTQQAYLKASNTGAGDQFGWSVAVAGDTVVVGALGEDSSTTGAGSTPDESATNAGAAYVFTGLGLAAPTLGTYSATSVGLGGNATVTPSAAPTGTTSIDVSAPTSFIGELTADPLTGVVRVTNAALANIPPGTYPVTVRAFGPGGTATATFNLTVTSGPACVGTSGFSGATNVGVGTSPYSVAVGDFNGDGRQDIASTSYNSNTVSIRLGDGLGGFSGTTDVSVGSVPISVAVGDFNGDGRQDIAAANAASDTVSIRLGDGSGGFSGTTNVGVGDGPYSVAVGDFNGDGKQDIAAANINSNTVSIRLGDGSGGFSGTTDVSVGSSPYSVAVGDFNGDGDQDIAAANGGSNTVSIGLGDGLGGFSGTTDVVVGSNPYSVAVGDFNGDGDQDIAAANGGSATVSIRLGDGLGGFSGTTNISVGTIPYSVAVGDFDGDGRQDIAAANGGSDTVSIRLGDGLGGFSGTTNVGVGSAPISVAVGDFNGDGRQDVSAANANSNTVSIRLGTCTPPPTVTNVSPAFGATAGGTAVTITGTNFTGATGVTFDGLNCPITGNSATQITCTAPAHAAGAVSVIVSTPGGANAANTFYTYADPPTAVNDTYSTAYGVALSRAASDPNDLLDNDTRAAPAANIVSFGGGSLGGTVTTNAAGATVAFAGGNLTVNANGSFSLTTPTVPGPHTFRYRIQNAAGFSDATVTIAVTCPTSPLVVTTNANSGAGSLRQAVIDACPGSVITFGNGGTNFTDATPDTITLTSGELSIDKNLTITGPGAGLLTISGNNASRVFNIGSNTPGIDVNLSALTIANGRVVSPGGGSALGGGIYNNSTGVLNITLSVISGNSVIGGASVGNGGFGGFGFGGGIFNGGSGTLNLTDSTVSGNAATGGAAASANGFGGSGIGGGVCNNVGGTVNITRSTVSGNAATGGALGTGVSAGAAGGGGIFNQDGGVGTGTVNVISSTISGNSATGGAGGSFFGGLGTGGGIANSSNGGLVSITSSTITGNSAVGGTGTIGAGQGTGGGVSHGGAVSITQVRDTIIAGNTAGGGVSSAGPDAFDSFNSQGYNLIGDGTGSS